MVSLDLPLDFYLRLFQVSLAPAAVVTATNDLHGLVSAPFAKLGLPPWFVRYVGLWKGMIIALNFLREGTYVPLAQSMLAMLMGGAIFTHAVIEQSAAKCLPALVFLASSVAVPILRGASRPVFSASVSITLAGVGYCIGQGIQAALKMKKPEPSKREC
ncbi:hypothetical protein T492DRAFT_882790 [Pavlovales sp. CCMP2436]|nr:hypothetical protein T492DRAFT_882790 [Pavlovales sp. CCMP2436]|mmetsp:Transcript_12922/g.32764  ORF Transcript_12922/g.32764 Transcript_12922/m.32764 type:complete len:159 (+) Transcript_12922:169-645(+)